MKKLSNKLTTLVSLTLALSLVLGSVNSAFAAELSNHGADEATYSVNDGKYNNDETYTATSSVEKNNLANDARESAEAAEKAVAEAQGILDTVSTGAITVSVEAAEEAGKEAKETASTIEGSVTNVETTVTNTETAKTNIETEINNSDSDLNADISKAETVTKDAVASASALEQEALNVLDETLDLDGEARVAKAKEAEEIAKQAGEVLETAKNSVEAAKKELDRVNKEFENVSKSAIELQKVTIEQLASEVSRAAIAYEQAKSEYNEALVNATKAKTAAENALSNATEKLNAASGAAITALDKADRELNYYVNIAQAAVDAQQQKLDENGIKRDAAKADREQKLAAYTNKVNDYTNAAIVAFEAKVREKQAAANKAQAKVDECKRKHDDLAKWKIAERGYWDIQIEIAKKELSEANDELNKVNKESVKQDMINSALTSSPEYIAYINAQIVENNCNSTMQLLENKMRELECALAVEQQRVVNAQNTYLTDIDNAGADARNEIITTLTQQIVKYGADINQVELDRDLNDWANGFLTAINVFDWDSYKDAKSIREYMDNTYNESYWKAFFNKCGITQWAVGTANLNETMSLIIDNYRELCRQAEEKKSDCIAEIAKIHAEEAKKNITILENDVAQKTTAAKEAVEKLNKISVEYETVIKEAETKIEQAKSNLEEIKNKVTGENSAFDLTNLLNAIAAAEDKVKQAEKNVEKVQAAKDKIDSFAEFAKNYAEYAVENGSLQKATAYAQLTSDALTATVNGLEANGNLLGFDLTTETVKSQGTSYFTKVSDAKQLTVSEEMYKAYLEAVVAYEKNHNEGCKNANGRGIATGTADNKSDMPLIYWSVDEEGKLTGKSYTDTTKMPSGKYFLGYSFKREGDLSTVGYHIDGFMLQFTAPEVDEKKEENTVPEIIFVNPNTTNEQNDDDTFFEKEAVNDNQETVEVEDLSVPAGEPAEDEEEALEEELVDIFFDETPEGEAAETNEETEIEEAVVLPQTGTASVIFFYGLGAACIILGGAVAVKARKEEE